MNKRAPNFTTTEEEILIQLVKNYQCIIESKKTDAVTNKDKEKRWEKIADEFSTIIGTHRDHITLKRKYENMKKITKRKFSEAKVNINVTGGGTSSVNLNSVDETIHSMLGPQISGLHSQYDCDADGVFEENNEENVEEVIIEEVKLKSGEQETDWGNFKPSLLNKKRNEKLKTTKKKHVSTQEILLQEKSSFYKLQRECLLEEHQWRIKKIKLECELLELQLVQQ